VPFESYGAVSYSHSIVTMAVSVAEPFVSFKVIETGIPFKSLGADSYLPSIVTMALSCIVCEIWRLTGRNHEIFIPHLYLSLPQRVPRRNFVKVFDAEKKPRMIGLPYGEKTVTIC